jgi:N-acetylglutamate synthase-like GNAT family acetyltransferase
MDNSIIHFTSRMLRIMRNAEIEAQNSKLKVLHPGHLLLSCLNERSGVLGEIALKCTIDKNAFSTFIKDTCDTSTVLTTRSSFFSMDVTEEILKVLEVAIGYMKRYNQIYVNEGHLLKALITTHVVDRFLTNEDREIILTLGTTSRDMITHLGHYTFPKMNSQHLIRKVQKNDKENLVRFVEGHFSQEWSQTIREAFFLNEPTISIAFDKKENITGFAGFDIYRNKKGYFGPMGVSVSNRTKGLGYALLHHCLKDMKEIGYEYAVIGEAGPIEFYEKACQAVVIPSVK